MGDAAKPLAMTPAEYLAFERASTEKHEYVDGQIFAMSGGTREHSLAGSNTLAELNRALFDRPCEVHGSDMKVRSGTSKYHYPDVSVVCGTPAFEDETQDVLLNPKLIVEVLSDSTERYDRSQKFASYRAIGTLEDYVLVSQTEVLVEHYHRHPEGGWMYRVLGPGQHLELPSLGCAIPVDRIYHRVFLEPLPAA
jgi:Uma2 family endonuclease